MSPKNKEIYFNSFSLFLPRKEREKELIEDNGIDVHEKKAKEKIFIRDVMRLGKETEFLCLMYVFFITLLRKIQKRQQQNNEMLGPRYAYIIFISFV